MPSIVELNNFVQGANGVYAADQNPRAFNYSDGEETEARLHKILSQAQDLSSESSELQAQIIDWPTEYHLSVTRANLLRPLKLDGVTRVLELGCGCGSISRYLGEQEGIHVDAVEGSPIRADLAALRCADLPNVKISTANFNDIAFPSDYYDLVLFVGVTEYAGRFSERETDQEALQDLLALGKSAAKLTGVVLVAIENRLGMKYLMGASEDHYAQPFVGLDNYPESTGIRTYSKNEWESQIEQAGFANRQFIYPFPDYKVPTLLLNETAGIEKNESVFSDIKSRDYSRDFDLAEDEHRIWQGLAAAGNLAEHSNSFLILMGRDKRSIASMAAFEVSHFANPELAYLTPQAPVANGSERAIEEPMDMKFLRAQLVQLQEHSKSLQETIDIMAGSSGWTWMNRVRRLLGKKSIR